MLIVLQHNAAHLGIVTVLCISEAINKYMKPTIGKVITLTAVLAAIDTLCKVTGFQRNMLRIKGANLARMEHFFFAFNSYINTKKFIRLYRVITFKLEQIS